MSLTVNFILKRPNRTYCEGEDVSGFIVIDGKTEGKHDGIILSLDGVLNVQMSSKHAGLLDSLLPTAKTVTLSSYAKEIAKPGKLQAGRTQLPFDFPLNPKPNKVLHETFHGAHIVIQYMLKCEIKRSLLAKDVLKSQEIIVHSKPRAVSKAKSSRKEFRIKPESLQNVRERSRIPKFLVEGYLDATDISLSTPVTGQLCVRECESGISSIELQLMRIETCGSTEVNTREVSEIQIIQLCSGDVPRGIAIPIYMILPRLFTCTTVVAPTFKIEFELNIIIIFDNDHLVVESFPIKLSRY